MDAARTAVHTAGMADDEFCATQRSAEPFILWLDTFLEDELPAIRDELARRIPELDHAPELVHALSEAITSHVPPFRSVLAGGDEIFDLPESARDWTRRMAELDIPLAVILRTYELSHAAIWTDFTKHLRQQTNWSAPRKALALETVSLSLLRYITHMTGRTIEYFAAVRNQMATNASSYRLHVIRSVLARTGQLRELEDVLGYRIDQTHIGYIAWTSDPTRTAEVGEAARRSISALASQHVALTAGSIVYGWFTPRHRFTVQEITKISLPDPLQMAFGTARPGHDGFIHTHNEALLTTEVAAPSHHPVQFADVAVAVLATRDRDLARRFVDDLIGPLLAHEDAERLIGTVRTYLDSLGRPRQCSKALNVHPNTVAQRIQRAEHILGRPIETADLALRVALNLTHTSFCPPATGKPGSGAIANPSVAAVPGITRASPTGLI